MASNASQDSSANENDDRKCWYNLIWLDENINNHGNKIRLRQISEIDPNIKTFISRKECIDYIREQNDKTNSHIILIVSGALSERVIPKIQDYICIFAIFIFCTNYDKYKHLKYQKLRTICIDTDELINGIELCISKFNDTTDFSVFLSQLSTDSGKLLSRTINKHLFHIILEPTTPEDNIKVQCSIRNLKEDQASFLWYRQMHEFMVTLENDDDKKAKEEMINRCREQYKEKLTMQLKIDEFSYQSMADNKEKAIFWYTDNSFMHHCTNSVLRKENISQVYSYRYIIKLICQHLKGLHKPFIDEYKNEKQKNSLRIYRGQHLKLEHIKLLKKNIKNLISLNGFVSTSRNRDIAMQFIRDRYEDGLEPVLFKIEVDMTSEHSVAFADISKFSRYPEEEEVLLSIGSVFQVKSVELVDVDDQLKMYVICLSLNQRNQVTVTKYIEQTYANNIDFADRSVLFGKLLFDMGECEAAIKYFLDALYRLSNDNYQLRATYLNNIGVCHNEMGRTNEALEHYNEALEIYEKTKNKRGLGACQHNVNNLF
jgi:tetratricopeptide (TPR) repeat protein